MNKLDELPKVYRCAYCHSVFYAEGNWKAINGKPYCGNCVNYHGEQNLRDGTIWRK